MAIHHRTETERVLDERAAYVARGVVPASIVVARAQGARIWDVDGRSYVDFAGGIGCQNTGHGLPAVVAAVHDLVDSYLHQCFLVGTYEPYVEVCRRLAELSPCTGGEQRSVLVNSGAEAVENAVKIARHATGRQAVVAFDHAYHGRTNLTMALTAKNMPYKQGFGPFAGEVYRVPMAYPLRWPDGPEACRAEIMDAVHPGGLGGTYGGNPVACAAALGAIETMEAEDLPGKARRIGDIMVPRLRKLASSHPVIAEVRGRGAMIAVELTKPGTLEPDAAATAAVARHCHSHGLMVLTCGTFGNVLRVLPPLVIGEDLLEEGLDILDDAFAAL